jgi:hypothetical protein
MNEYSTQSLFLASFLKTCDGINFKGIDKTDLRNILFIFSPKEKAEEMVNRYYTDKEFNCNARELIDDQNTLKDVIFESKRQSL